MKADNKSAIQMLFLCLVGLFTFTEQPKVAISTFNKPVAVAQASKLEMDIDAALSSASLKEKENVYKVFSGIVDYSNNSERTYANRELEEMMTEVILTYKLEMFSSLDSIIYQAVADAGLVKNEKLADAKPKIAKAFGELAAAVKHSIENDKDFKSGVK